MNIDVQLKGHERSCLGYWYSKLLEQKLAVPMPKTVIFPVSRDGLLPVCDGEETAEIRQILKEPKQAARKIGYPLFLRTDLASGKHSWKDSCYVPNEEVLADHIVRVIESNEMADLFGLPYKALVFREFLELEWSFKAFWGEMPVAKERRYFVLDGNVLCHHPYWPPAAIHTPSIEDWEPLLTELNQESELETMILSAFARQISQVLEGYWSLDFAYARNGTWYLIDAADGYISYHWEGCSLQLELPEEDIQAEEQPNKSKEEPAPWME